MVAKRRSRRSRPSRRSSRHGNAAPSVKKALTMPMSELREEVAQAHRAWRKAANAVWGPRVTHPSDEAKKQARIVKLKKTYDTLSETLTLRARRGES